MSSAWSVIALLGFLTALNTVAVIALIRQVGVLHFRIRPLPALGLEEGPQPGDAISFTSESWPLSRLHPDTERVILGFFQPSCSLCGPLMGSFRAFSETCEERERVVLISDAEASRAKEYLQSKRVRLPLIAEPTAFSENGIPGAPYAVVTDSSGEVLTAGGVNSLEQLEWLVDQARNGNQLASASAEHEAHVVQSKNGGA